MNPRAVPLLVCLLLALGAFTAGYVGNEDFGWYLASGDEILERGAIPERDPFLYTSSQHDVWVTSGARQRTWVTHSWGWTLLLASLRRGFGLEGIAVFSTWCAALLAVLLFSRAQLDRFGLVGGLLTAAALAASLDRFTPRTDLVSALGLVVFLALLERSPPLRWRRVALLCGLQALWANLHGGFPLGIALAAAYLAGDAQRTDSLHDTQRADSARDEQERRALPTDAARAPALALLPLLVLASLLPPQLGLERIAGALAFARELFATGAGHSASPILEWQPTFAAGLSGPALFHLGWMALGAASFALAQPPLRRSRALAFAGMALLGAAATRFVSLFALVAAFVVLSNLAAIRTPLRARLAAARHPALRALHVLATAIACAALVAMAAALWRSRHALDGRDALDGRAEHAGFVAMRPEFTAPGAAAYLLAQRPPGPIFNEISLGGDLIDALHPHYPLFIDTRNLSAALLDEYRHALARPAAWSALARRERFGIVVLSNLSFSSSALRRQLGADAAWRLAFLDPQACVFVRNDVAVPQQLVPAGRWGDAAPFLPPGGHGPQRFVQRYGRSLLLAYLRALADLAQPVPLDAIATRALERLPDDGTLLAYRGYARLQLGRAAEAAEDYAGAVRDAPADVSARLGLARALIRSGRAEQALPQIDAALALAPGHRAATRLRARITGAAPPGADEDE